jgi:hypothetical protein
MIPVRYPAPPPPVDLGPRSRVVVDDLAGDEPAIRTALTRAWREAGQPLTVVVSSRATAADLIAATWAREHAVAGIELEVRHTVVAATPRWRLLQVVARGVEMARAVL